MLTYGFTNDKGQVMTAGRTLNGNLHVHWLKHDGHLIMTLTAFYICAKWLEIFQLSHGAPLRRTSEDSFFPLEES